MRKFRSKRRTRKRSYRRRRPTNRRTSHRGRVYNFTRTYSEEHSIQSIGWQTFGAGSIQTYLTDLPNYAEFTDLFDSYRICAIQRKFIYNRNSAESISTANTAELPMLYTVFDYNEGNVLANEDEALQYSNLKISRLDRITKRYYKPAIKIENSMTVWKRWLPTTNTAEQYFGMKFAVDTIKTGTTETIGTLKVFTKVYLQCKNPK